MLDIEDLAYYTYRPRPDQPERFDQQESFYHSFCPGVAFLVGGNGSGTTETALAKVARFVLNDQPPPRHDTPFWIIAESYEQVMESAWKEKLFGHGHIPPFEVDWERVKWYREKDAWPYRVPLRPWPDLPGKNWTLEFKSYGQGRQQMQARSIGGFLFCEQFPWGLLEEVLRGCREYSYPGSKLAEFTPIDPVLSAPLEEMINDGKLPDGWEIYRCNTQCALEAGHVSPQWYSEFFGLISEDMRPVREIGAFASFAGAVYTGFNPAIHCLSDDRIDHPPGCYYRRAIDWGFGPENPFACVFGYKNGAGEWMIFEEYESTAQVTVHEHLKAVSDLWPWPEKNMYYGQTYADPSDPGNIRIAARFNEFCPDYPNFNMAAASNRVSEGIDYVKMLLQINPATGRPRLRISKRCKNLIRELRTYRYERGADTGRNPRDAKPVPLKKDDHTCDALRYLLFSDAVQSGVTPELKRREREPRRHGIQLAMR